MDQRLYERPREKIQRRGATFLTSIELMQLIIGSGSAKASSARISRHIVKAIEQGRVSYDDLLSIGGLGNAKVCQILAVLEWARRFNATSESQVALREFAQRAIAEVQHSWQPGVTCYWFDGANTLIDKKHYPQRKGEHAMVFAGYVFSDVVAVSARSVVIFIASRHSILNPTVSQLDDMLAYKDTAALLSVRIQAMYGVSKHHARDWTKELP